MTKRLGSDPFEWVTKKDSATEKNAMPAKQHAAKPAKAQASTPVKQNTGKITRKVADPPLRQSKPLKATYYVQPLLVRQLKYVGIDTGRDLSDLINEAIYDLLEKYHRVSSI